MTLLQPLTVERNAKENQEIVSNAMITYVQLTVNGVNGDHLVPVQRPVVEGYKNDTGNVTLHYLFMVARNVQEQADLYKTVQLSDVQLMVNGPDGEVLEPAQSPVEEALKNDTDHVQHPPPNMVDEHVLECHVMLSTATIIRA